MDFIGRKKEIDILRRLGACEEASLAVIYGRRRVGKSSLVLEAFKNHTVYSFEGVENQSTEKQINYFLEQLREVFGSFEQKPKNWYQALKLLSDQLEDNPAQPIVVFFDELQWTANYRSELINVFKTIWDRSFSKKKNLTIILCGSIASFMVGKVIKSKALYGRASSVIHLKPFKLNETKEYFKEKSSNEIITAQMVVGGIPGYLRLLKNQQSIMLGIQKLAFEEHGYLISEYDRIFISQFGSSEYYERIVKALGNSPNGLNRYQISKELNLFSGGTLTKYLNNLEMAGFISSYKNFNSSSKEKKFRLTDPYLRFYFKFIKTHFKDINLGKPNIFIKLSNTQSFKAWLGYAAEILCHEHSYELSKIMGFSDVDYNSGPYKGKEAEIDLVFDRKDEVITLCEIKYRDTLPPSLIQDVEKKASILPNKKNKTIQKALILKNPPSQNIIDSAYFSHIVTLENLLK